jgi:fibronectin-binding autotransporter adhesin
VPHPKRIMTTIPPSLRPLATRFAVPTLRLALLAGALLATEAGALADKTKANNATALQSGGSWVEGSAPVAGEIGIWDSTVTAANTVSFSGGTWLGIKIGTAATGNPGGAVTINNSGTWTLGNSTGGSTVIDLSEATQDLTINGGFLRLQGGSGSTIAMNVATNLNIGSTITDLGNNKTLSLTGAGNIFFNGSFSPANPLGFAVNGANVVLSGTNTFNLGSGSFAVNSGSLNIGNDGALGGLGTVLLNGGTLASYLGAHTIAPAVALGGVASIGGSVALTINGSFTNSGGDRTLNISSVGSTTLAGNVFLSETTATGRTLNITGAGPLTISGVIANANGTGAAGGLTYAGSNTLVLSNANTFGGALTVNGFGGAGAVRIDHVNAVQFATVSSSLPNGVTFGPGLASALFGGLAGAGNLSLINSDLAAVNLLVGNNNAATTYAGVLNGTGSLTKVGTQTTTFSVGGQLYSGATNVSGGTLQTNASGNTQTNLFGTGAIGVSSGGRVRFNSSSGATFNNALDVGTGGGTLSFRGNSSLNPTAVTGTGALTLELDNNVTLTPSTLGGFAGTINVMTFGAGGTFRLGGTFDNLSLGSAKLNLGAGISLTRNAGTSGTVTTNIGTLSGAVGSSLGASLSGSGTFIFSIGGRGEDAAFAGMIVDGSTKTALTKVGAGVETLSGLNVYSGPTRVDGGTLLVSGSINGTSSIAVNGARVELGASNSLSDFAPLSLTSATLATAGFSDSVGQLTLATATLDLGTGASVLQFSSSSAQTWTGILSITNWSGSPTGGGTDQVYFGSFSSGLTPAQVAEVRFVDPAGFDPGTYAAQILPTGEITAVPEPGAALSLLGGFGCLVGLGRFRRRA